MRYSIFLISALSLSFVILEGNNQEIPFTDEDIDLVVSLQNQVRALNITPVASDMRHVYWDEDLAKFAQEWSNKCRYIAMDNTTTDLWSEAGQNYFVAAAGWSDKFHYSSVLRWLEQQEVFTYEDGTCTEFCGEYRQLAFSKTFKVGCAATFCSILEMATGEIHENATLYLCTYYPKVPATPGYQLFSAGPACSNCSDPTDICTDFKLCTNPERQVTMGELKRKAEEEAEKKRAANSSGGWSTMQTAIAAASGGVGILAAVGAIIKLFKGSAVGPSALVNQSEADVPAQEPPVEAEGQPEAPPEEPAPEETITNGKAPTIPIDAPEG